MSLGDTVYDIELYVAPISDDMLLGLDFLLKNKALINLESGILWSGMEQFQMNGSDDLFAARVFVKQRTVVPPLSVKFVNCETKGFGSEYMVQPRDHTSMLMPRSLYSGDTQYPKLCMVNLSDANVALGAGQCVATATEVSEIPVTRALAHEQIRVIPEYLVEMLKSCEENVSGEEYSKIKELILDFADVIAKDDYDLGTFSEIEHSNETGDARSVKHKIRKNPMKFADEEKIHLDKMLKAKVIQPSNSEWASAPVLIRKRDGSVRWCVDYRALNNITTKDVVLCLWLKIALIRCLGINGILN